MVMLSENNALNSRIISDLRECIDATQLMRAYQHPRKNGRLYGYCDVLRNACGKCFYWRDGVVYVFDGRVWVPFSPDVLKYLVRDVFVDVAGIGSEVVKSDWVDSERKLWGYALDGIMSHVLEYNASLVGFSNGVWDFSDMSHPVRHSFSERMPVTSLLGYKYDPSAGCPVWLNFLKMMLPSQRDVDMLQVYSPVEYETPQDYVASVSALVNSINEENKHIVYFKPDSPLNTLALKDLSILDLSLLLRLASPMHPLLK